MSDRLVKARDEIDKLFGPGSAKAHPELLGMLILADAVDRLAVAWLAGDMDPPPLCAPRAPSGFDSLSLAVLPQGFPALSGEAPP